MKTISVSIIVLAFLVLAGGEIYSADQVPTPPSKLDISSGAPPPPPPPPPSGNQGLLSGMTPSKNTLPIGWSLVRKQDFEGELGSGEGIAGSITANRPHSGTKSLQKTYTSGDQIGRWTLAYNATSGREIYLSWWEYLEPQATLNTEIFLFRFLSKELDQYGAPIQDFTAQFYGQPSNNPPLGYNATHGGVVFHSEGGSSWPKGNYLEYYEYMKDLKFSTDISSQGTWRQYEVYYKPNSVVNGVAQEDGKAIMYVNGIKFMETKSCSDTNYYNKSMCVGASQPNSRNLNGAYDMIGAKIEIGGVYTAQKWVDANGNCVPLASGGKFFNCRPFATCAPCPVTADFNRFIDDIIVMQK